MTTGAPPRAITLEVTPGPIAEESCGRLAAVTGTRCELPVTQVEGTAASVRALARVAAGRLADAGGRLELTIVEMPGAMQITLGLFEPGGAREVLEACVDSRPAGHPIALRTGAGERLSFEVSSAPIIDGIVPGGQVPYSAVQTTHESGVPVLAVTGEIDVSTAPSLELAARHALVTGDHRLVLDLGGSSFLDSTGIRALIGLAGACSEGGGIAIANMNAAISRALEITGLSSVFSIHSSVDDAARSISG